MVAIIRNQPENLNHKQKGMICWLADGAVSAWRCAVKVRQTAKKSKYGNPQESDVAQHLAPRGVHGTMLGLSINAKTARF